jgi:hypothetical protein
MSENLLVRILFLLSRNVSGEIIYLIMGNTEASDLRIKIEKLHLRLAKSLLSDPFLGVLNRIG